MCRALSEVFHELSASHAATLNDACFTWQLAALVKQCAEAGIAKFSGAAVQST